RKLVFGAFGKTGIVWFLDRETGEFIRAVETVYQNVQTVDPVTGAVTINTDLVFDKMGETKFVCPHLSGGKLYNSGAYNPLTNAYYVPLNNTCMEATPREVEFRPGESVAGLASRMVHAPNSGRRGAGPSSPPPAASSAVATPTGASRRLTPRPARCSGSCR